MGKDPFPQLLAQGYTAMRWIAKVDSKGNEVDSKVILLDIPSGYICDKAPVLLNGENSVPSFRGSSLNCRR